MKRIYADKYILIAIVIGCVLIVWLTRSKTPVPALQSVWFIPHVAVYMFGYVVMAWAFVLAVLELFFSTETRRYRDAQRIKNHCVLCENSLRPLRLDMLINIGTTALGIGLCFGALWAKKAWGQYWSWDIKETFALITWVIFLLYIHLQKIKKINRKILLMIVIVGFLSLSFTWQGVKYLPSSKKSPHTFYKS